MRIMFLCFDSVMHPKCKNKYAHKIIIVILKILSQTNSVVQYYITIAAILDKNCNNVNRCVDPASVRIQPELPVQSCSSHTGITFYSSEGQLTLNYPAGEHNGWQTQVSPL